MDRGRCLENGLVDLLGGLEDAIRIAADKAGLSHYQISELPVERSAFEDILLNFSQSIRTRILKSELGDFYDTYREQKDLLKIKGMVARIPYDLTFN